MMDVIKHEEYLFLSIVYLNKMGLSHTVKKWRTAERSIGIWDTINEKLYIRYDSIPSRTKKKLPSLSSLKAQQQQETKKQEVKELSKELDHAFYFQHAQYKVHYETESNLSQEQITRFSKLHSVLQCIINIKDTTGLRDLKNLFEIFNNLFPGKYKSKHALSNVIRKAKADGIQSVALDKRVFGNNNEQTNKTISPVTQWLMSQLLSHPRKFSNTKILELLKEACDDKGYKCPSLSWVKKHRQRLLKNIVVYNSRYGHVETNKKMPFASMKHATYANDQWQMDGWTLPFWTKGETNFQRYVVVLLIDSNSKRIVGYSVGKSENTVLIIEAIRNAVNNTGVLPYEILTDNHAFNQTKEAKILQSLLQKKGTRWTITQNPQHKSIIERYNRNLNDLCKDYYGYLGESIRAKGIDALAKPEMIDQYVKNQIDEQETKARGIVIVEKHNGKKMLNGKTPNDLYKENANPHPIVTNEFDRAELLTLQTEKKVIRGQITFKKGIVKHEFQLPASLYQTYNDTTVKVCYEDLRECIYVFNIKTGEPVACLHPKEKINGAKINQTDTDITALNKHSGRIKGIKSKAAKQLQEITERALKTDPEAHLILNALTTPKNVKQELEENSTLRQIAEASGLPLSTLDVPERHYPGATIYLQPKKSDSGPFTAKGNKIEVIDRNSLET